MSKIASGPARFSLSLSAASFAALLAFQTPAVAAEIVGRFEVSLPSTAPGVAADLDSTTAVGDFDGDGQQDIAISISTADLTAVNVYLAQGSGFVLDEQILAPPDHSGFGISLASGDFEGDGRDELAIGAAYAESSLVADLLSGNVTIWERTTLGGWFSSKTLEESVGLGQMNIHELGFAVAAGDFNGDGFDDLAYGCPGHNVSNVAGAGLVHVVYGDFPNGLDTEPNLPAQEFTQTGLGGTAAAYDGFGRTLAAGDFKGDAFADLAIAAPDKTVNGVAHAGGVAVVYGTSSGLSGSGASLFDRATAGVEGNPVTFEQFGYALAAGSLNFQFSGGGDELVVGVPGAAGDRGAIQVFYGSSSGLGLTSDQVFDLSTVGMVPQLQPAAGDRCGAAIVVGRLSTFGTVAFDCPGRDLGTQGAAANAGMVVAMHSSASGLAADGGEKLELLHTSVTQLGPYETGDSFGKGMAIGTFNADTVADLAVFVNRGGGMFQVFLSALFADGFEKGDTSSWSSTTP